MSLRRAGLVVLGVLIGSAACGDQPAPADGNDTTLPFTPPPALSDSELVSLDSPLDSVVGPVILVVSQFGTQGSVIFPTVLSDVSLDTVQLDASVYRGRRFDLIGNGRSVGTATLSSIVAVDIPDECSAWPLAQLTGTGTPAGDSLSRGWAVAFEEGRMTPLAFDSIAGLATRDSSRLAIEIARLASALPHDSVSELQGLPYKVRRAHRFSVVPGVQGVFAEVVRSLPQEASPKHEHLLLIAERDSVGRAPYRVLYSERSAGGEEQLESTELLAVARVRGTGGVDLILARYIADGVIYSLLERRRNGQWLLRWSSPYAGC